MKYYLYISDAKVDMLLPQVPHEIKKKTATEMGFDLKVLKMNRKTETESDENRITRLETVLSFIREYGKVGSIDEPDDFIDDTEFMPFDSVEPLVYFTGTTKRSVFALAGSTHHLLGSNSNSSTVSKSLLSSIIHWLNERDRTNGEPDKFSNHALGSICAMALDSNTGGVPKQRLEFFAKRLLFDSEYNYMYAEKKIRVLLATPLYVAMTD